MSAFQVLQLNTLMLFFKVTEVHRKVSKEEKITIAKKEEAPPKRGI